MSKIEQLAKDLTDQQTEIINLRDQIIHLQGRIKCLEMVNIALKKDFYLGESEQKALTSGDY